MNISDQDSSNQKVGAQSADLEDLREQNRRLQKQVANLTEQARIDRHKKRRENRMKADVAIHPSADKLFADARARSSFRGATGIVAAVLAHGGTKNLLTYYDPGPHPLGKKEQGWHNTPAISFERCIVRLAAELDGAVTSDFVIGIAAEIERMVDERMNTIHARVHRAINSIAWLLHSQVPNPGPEPEYWLLRDPRRCAEPADEDPAELADTWTASAAEQELDAMSSDFSIFPDDALAQVAERE